jgi:hypothetical protein
MEAARVGLLVGIAVASLARYLDFTVDGRGRVNLDSRCTFRKEGILLHIHVPRWEANFELFT